MRRNNGRQKTVLRGYDGEWRMLRAHILKLDNGGHSTVYCGCGQLATVVDHIVPIAERPDLRLAPTNLRPMCKRCHDRHTIYTRGVHAGRTRRGGGCDTDGNPLDPPNHWQG
ncbi:MAG: HNH endonuclease [Candidatus Competibacteraceae bacterium]|nr:HNH endonuclease [Candidatus Competibacteraceae bacterium]